MPKPGTAGHNTMVALSRFALTVISRVLSRLHLRTRGILLTLTRLTISSLIGNGLTLSMTHKLNGLLIHRTTLLRLTNARAGRRAKIMRRIKLTNVIRMSASLLNSTSLINNGTTNVIRQLSNVSRILYRQLILSNHSLTALKRGDLIITRLFGRSFLRENHYGYLDVQCPRVFVQGVPPIHCGTPGVGV